MPVVKREKRGFAGRVITVVTKVSAGGTFSIEMPKEVTDKLGVDEVTGKTLSEVRAAFDDALERHGKANTVKRKVILYRLKFACVIYEGDRIVLKPKNGCGLSFTEGTALDLAVGVYEESCTTIGTRKTVSYEPVDSSIPRGLRFRDRSDLSHTHHSRMAYTPEREEFFARIGTALESLILKLDALFEDPKLHHHIDTGKALRALPPAPARKTDAKA